MTERSRALTIVGRITHKQETPLRELAVQAFLSSDGRRQSLGKPTTAGSDGFYAIELTASELEELYTSERTRLLVVVSDGDLKLGESESKRIERPRTTIDVRLDTRDASGDDPTLRVHGTVRDPFGEILDNVVVEAYDRDLRNEQLLGSSSVKCGQYEIKYQRKQFRKAEKDSADLVMKVFAGAHEKKELYRTPVHFNVPDDHRLDIVLQGHEYRGPSEWEVLNAELSPLLEDVLPQDIREDEQFQDVSFLAGETGRTPLAIAVWAASHDLAEKTEREKSPLPPEVFFGFMRQGQPSMFTDTLLADMRFPERRALLEDKILRALSELAPALQESLLQKALADDLIPARTAPLLPEVLATLAQIKLRYAAETTFGGGKGTIGELLALTPEAKQHQVAFLAAFTAHTGPLDNFWKKLAADEILPPKAIEQVQRSFALGALTRNHIALVAELGQRFESGTVKHLRELAGYDRAQWKAIFAAPGPDGKPIEVPANIDGDTPEERYETYAALLEQQLERSYPTAAFVAKLGRGQLVSLARTEAPRATVGRSARATAAASGDMLRFFANSPQFQLDRYRLDHFVAENEGALDGVEDKPATVQAIKTVQRAFKLSPTAQGVNALLAREIDSAQQVYFMGEGQFVRAMTDSGLNKLEAKKMYRKAENTYASALALFGDFNQGLNGPAPFAVPSQKLDAETQARIATLPDLQTLFGSLDYCECAHCRSVYSPAAHMVDILRFLGDRGTHGTGIHAGKSVRDVLLERRPDLGEIELSCENTNTAMPYIDLVNEVLADVVAPPTPIPLSGAIEVDLVEGTIRDSVLAELRAKGVPVDADAWVHPPDVRDRWVVRDSRRAYKIFRADEALALLPSRQTFLSPAELRANPEYGNQAAYDRLRREVFPLALPYDQPFTQVRTYLDHLGVPQPRLLELFQQSRADGTLAPGDLQIDCTWLGLTDFERTLLTGTLTGKSAWDFWGLAETGNAIPHPDAQADPTRVVTGTWIEVLAQVPVLLHRSGLAYKELLQLLDTRYVNADGAVVLHDSAEANAASCDTSTFRVLGLDEDRLQRVHRFVRLWRKLGCKMWELDLLLPDTNPAPETIDKQITDAALRDLSQMDRLRRRAGLDWRVVRSLFAGIDHVADVDRSGEGTPAVQTLYQRLFRNKLVDAVASFPVDPSELTGTIAARVPGILAAFRIKEIELVQILAALSLGVGAGLDIAVLGQIHRITVLAKVVGLSIDAFLRLLRLSGQDPFASPAAALELIELADQLADGELSVAELDYLLAHRFVPGAGIALEDKAIFAFAQAIRDGLRSIDDELRLKSEETQQTYIRSRLGLLPALARDADQATALGLIEGTFQGDTAARDALVDAFFTGVLDTGEARSRLGTLPGGLSPADRQTEIDARCAFVQPALQAFLLASQKTAFIRQKVGEVMLLDVPSASLLLAGLRLAGASTPLLGEIDDDRLLARGPDGSYQLPLDEASFPDLFASARLLHKSALLTKRLGLVPGELSWWLEANHAADLGWLSLAELPLAAGGSLPLARFVALQQFVRWRNDLPKSDLTAFELAASLLDAGKSSAAVLAMLARLTLWDPEDIGHLAVAFRWLDATAGHDVVKAELRKSASLVRLGACMRALRRLGVNAARAIEWARAEPTSADADGLKQTVKAKYDLQQWQEVILPLQDGFREQQRQALVAWLVAHPDPAQGHGWVDANGLYNHFLIDVEMCACMLTSRLKQAVASAQLFVQRCLLNLETDVVARVDTDPKWKQWQWMKRYRVWEANRKVFLYPENWLEPQLRDEKSPFFKDLEKDLLQNEVTAETAEQAFHGYLEKLDRVSNLEIRAIHEQIISQDESILHVIGRSRSSQAPEYYYRKRINNARWTAWERVDLEIQANHLLAGVHNRRLFLLWPQFLEKGEAPSTVSTPSANSSATLAQPTKFWDVRLFWSELRDGKWSPGVLSDSFERLYQSRTGGDNPANVSLRTRLNPNLQVRLYTSTNPSQYAPMSQMRFDKLGRQISRNGAVAEHIISPADSRYHHNLIQHSSTSQYFYYSAIEESGKPHTLAAHENALAIRLLRNIVPNATYTVVDNQARGFAGDGSFFVWDPSRTYFVDYSWRTDYSYVSRALRARVTSAFRYYPHYHPFVDLFIKELDIWGLPGLLNRRIQVSPASVPGSPAPFDFSGYQPDFANVVQPLPVEDVDFSYLGAYAPYNWELFFHAPLFIAGKLAANQRFEEALAWFHYIFDPTSTEPTTADPGTPQQKFWITRPFYEATKADYYKQRIENIMLGIARGDAELREQVREWRDNPFNPHLIARMRTVAYQKNVLIKYIQTLTAWADQLFRQDTIESINEATQLYVLASSILGPRPRSIPKRVANPIKTFYQLQGEGIDVFGNALREVENLLPPASAAGTLGEDAPELPHLSVLYFGIPANEKLVALWDTVEDRLFKIRHCMNIEGVVRQLALYEPPIDPALLVKASAAGLDLASVLSDMNAPLPLYRFGFMIGRALDLCNEVKALGGAMLAALEKRDAEAFALLRSGHEQQLFERMREIKAQQVEEAARNKEALQETRKVVDERRAYHEKLVNDGLSGWEIASLALSGGALVAEVVSTVLNAVGAGTSMIPEVNAGASGFGGSPHLTVSVGGRNVTSAVSKAADVSRGIASILQIGAGMTSTIAGHYRRADDWAYQKRLAEKELPQTDKQIAAAEIRHGIARRELAQQEKQIENAQKEDEFLRSKFTNQELYDWMVDQLSTVYFQSYQLAYDVAKRAERSFRYELGLADSSFVQFGYWDSLKKGLLSAEKLHHDLKRLESAYHEQNRRDYELTKHVSLAQLDPLALVKLRQNGECFVDLPETLFDLDYPGHYFRRLKSVSLSIPCVAGPYTTVACTLTLTHDHLRKDPTLLAGAYARDTEGDDPRFRDEVAAIQSVATSHAQNDSGMFEMSFRDERYLPFEGAGAISSWHLKLNAPLALFDVATISDVIIHLSYTAREGGELLAARAAQELRQGLDEQALAESRRGLYRVFDLKRELPDSWYRFLQPSQGNQDQALDMPDLAQRLPFFTREFASKKARRIEIIALMKDPETPGRVLLSPLGSTPADLLPLAPDPTYAHMHRAFRDLTGAEVDLGAWTLKLQLDGAADFRSLPSDAVEELFLAVNYTLA